MSEKRRDSIADDWEEVESAASVISFDSRPSTPSPSSPQEPPVPVPVPTTSQAIVSSTEAPLDTASTSQLPLRLKNDEPDSSSISEDQQLQPGSVFFGQPPEKQDDASPIPDPNPGDYHRACQAITQSLDSVAELAFSLGGYRISTMHLIRSTCENVSAQTKELDKMLEGYAKHWVSKGSNMAVIDDVPLDPELWDMMSELKELLLNTHTELSTLIPARDATDFLFAKDIPLHTNLALARYLESLEDTNELFTEFLPIFKADFDEFRTQHMAFQAATSNQDYREPHRQPPHPKVRRIRQELYDLKDRFVLINVFLSRLKDSHPSPKVTDPEVFKSLKRVVEAISTVLTNNPSEWIDSDSAPSTPGAMSYPQFITLDPDVLHDVTSHLKGYQEELDIDPHQDGGSYSDEMIRNHQEFLLLEGGQLEELRSVINFTESMLMMQN
ncbi:hypothetical protein F53441_2705 [Fusarium austroafricanum]|uniref:Uncharacterized protein n=1 Tax=Fusarium austroafricanum TaxID=2364996 RepID=A0A8H4KRE7_9HYPO|nr:hypothetical protein F53441_2705 [Fusarium austroafricanum]